MIRRRARTTAPARRAFGARALGASTGLHVLGIAGAGALIAWAGTRAPGGEPQRVVAARAVEEIALSLESVEPLWEVEAPSAAELEATESEPVARESSLADEPLAFERPSPAPRDVASVSEPFEWPRFEPPLELASEPPPAPEPEPETIVTGEPDREPLLLEAPAPAYPVLARRRGWQGSVVCSLRVNAYGKVVEAEVLVPSGHPVLDAAALEAVLTWRFRPGRRDGEDDTFEVEHRVTFQLRG